jgi:uncharacterized protein (TIGR02646 family)
MADSGLGGRRRLRDRLEHEQKGVIPGSFVDHWSKPDVKGFLHAMQGRICAYCGMETNALDVEHFRPKGAIEEDAPHDGYWWLAYECSNYLLGCTVCNQRRKRTSFPLLPGATRTTYATRDTISMEQRVLLNPAEDPVEEWLTIDPEDVTGRLIPNPNLGEDEQLRVQYAIDLLGVNLDQAVRGQRSRAYEKAVRAAVEQRWDDLRRSAMRHRPHSLISRIVLQRVAPEYLPSAEEEMTELLALLWRDLARLMHEIQSLRARAKASRPMDERHVHVLAWALVVLQSDPPADPATADTYLEELLKSETTEIRAEVVTLFRTLQ